MSLLAVLRSEFLFFRNSGPEIINIFHAQLSTIYEQDKLRAQLS